MSELEQFAELEELRAANRRLQSRLTKAEAKVEDLVAAVYQAAKDAAVIVGRPQPVPAPKRGQPTSRAAQCERLRRQACPNDSLPSP